MKKCILRFIVIGGISTLIDFGIYWICSKVCDISIAKFVSMLIASVLSYILNKLWTFEDTKKTNLVSLVKYYITFGVNMGINISINRWIFICSGNKFIAFVVATGCAMIVNFLLQNFWVFRKEK